MSIAEDPTQRILTAGAGGYRCLTNVDIELLLRFAQGMSSKEIAAMQKVSPRTIEGRRLELFGKLGAKNAAHAVAIMFKKGIFL